LPCDDPRFSIPDGSGDPFGEARGQPGDRVALVSTDDPDTRLRPGDEGTVTRYDPKLGQLGVSWDCGSTLSMLPGEGDQVRLLARAASEDGTEPGNPGDPGAGEPAPDGRQDITDPATGLSRLLSERCPTCILRAGDPIYLGPGRTAAFIRQVLDTGSYVVCHDTLTYGDFPGYGPAICRGFFDAYRNRTPDLLILQAGRRLTEVPPPSVAQAEELGRDAGRAAAGRVVERREGFPWVWPFASLTVPTCGAAAACWSVAAPRR